MIRRLLAVAATVTAAVLLTGCHPLHPERCSRMIITASDGQQYVPCQGGLRPTGGGR